MSENAYHSQSDQSEPTSPKTIQSKSASQEFSTPNRGTQGSSQSHAATVTESTTGDRDSRQQSNHGGNNKPVGRTSFRLSETPEEEDGEDVSVVNKRQANRKVTAAVEGSTKTSETTSGPELHEGMIDKVSTAVHPVLFIKHISISLQE